MPRLQSPQPVPHPLIRLPESGPVVSPMELVERVKDPVRGGAAGLRTVAVPAPRNGGDGAAAAWTGGVHFCFYLILGSCVLGFGFG